MKRISNVFIKFYSIFYNFLILRLLEFQLLTNISFGSINIFKLISSELVPLAAHPFIIGLVTSGQPPKACFIKHIYAKKYIILFVLCIHKIHIIFLRKLNIN